MKNTQPLIDILHYFKIMTLTKTKIEETAITEKKLLLIFKKTKIKYFNLFCINIKQKIEPTTKFTCKSTLNTLKLITNTATYFRAVIKYLKEKNIDFIPIN
jgi:hypothetical protein